MFVGIVIDVSGGCSYQYPMEHLTCFHGYLLVFGFHSKFPKLLALDNESGASDFTVIGLSAENPFKWSDT